MSPPPTDTTMNAVRGLARRVARIEKVLGLTTEETLDDLSPEEVAEYRVQAMAAAGGPLPDNDMVEVKHRKNELAKAAK